MDKILKVLGILFLVGGVFVLGSCGLLMLTVANDPDVQEAVKELERTSEEMKAPPIITLAEFNQIQSGMTYEKVVEIVGAQGTVLSENSLPNFEGGQMVTRMYAFENGDFSNANVTIQDGKVVSKAQFGLK